jgi:hypothetical protein
MHVFPVLSGLGIGWKGENMSLIPGGILSCPLKQRINVNSKVRDERMLCPNATEWIMIDGVTRYLLRGNRTFRSTRKPTRDYQWGNR